MPLLSRNVRLTPSPTPPGSHWFFTAWRVQVGTRYAPKTDATRVLDWTHWWVSAKTRGASGRAVSDRLKECFL